MGHHRLHSLPYKDSDADTRRLMLTVSYTFNPKKSKYKGEGAANDEMKRL